MMLWKELETERLILKNISKDDHDFVLGHFSDSNVVKYLYDAEPMKDMVEAYELIDSYLEPEPRGHHRWVLVRKSDGIKLGTCGFHCLDTAQRKIEIGYDLNKDFWGNGYMQEALKASINYLLQNSDIQQIDAHISIDNEKSIQLVKKLGFVFGGECKIYVFRGQEYLHHIYTWNK